MARIKTGEYVGCSTSITKEIKKYIVFSSYLMGDIEMRPAMDTLGIPSEPAFQVKLSRFSMEFPEFRELKNSVAEELSAYRYTIAKRHVEGQGFYNFDEVLELGSFNCRGTCENYCKRVRLNPEQVYSAIQKYPEFQSMTDNELQDYYKVIMEKAYSVPSLRCRIKYGSNNKDSKAYLPIGKHPEYIVLYIMGKLDKKTAFKESGYTSINKFDRAIKILEKALTKI